MQLTKRFFAMNVLAVFVSVAFTVLVVILFIAVYTRWFGPEANLQDWQRSLEVRTGLGEIRSRSLALPFEELLEGQFQQELTERMKTLGAEAVVLLNREVVFSTAELNPLLIEKSLMLTSPATDLDTLKLDDGNYMVARADYSLHSGDKGVLLLLAPLQVNTQFHVYLVIFAVGFFILIFLLLNGWVSYRFSQSVIAPVARLKEAAVKISEGDLTGGIAEEGEGEVRELNRTLELMRIKLKESIYLQRKYDENRRFLVSSISHDLKTPVTSIIGYIEGIIDGVARTPEKQAEYLETARSKAMLVNAMIDDLLLYSKLDLNQIPFHFEKTDLASYFEDCVADYRDEFVRANLLLVLTREIKEKVFVYIDRERFKRVVQNILDNAKKYMDKAEGRVEVVLRETPASAIIEIRDDGKGIPEDHLSRIFVRFYRGDPARKTAEGSGLGLAIAKQIVESHEGKIWVTSQVGKGTRVMISLKKF